MEQERPRATGEEGWRVLECGGRVEEMSWNSAVACFVDPGCEPNMQGWDLLAMLGQIRVSAAVVGESGSGKTHAAWMYEYAQRWQGGRVIVPIGVREMIGGTGRIAVRMAQAGMVAYLERFIEPGGPLALEEKRKLMTLVEWGGNSVKEMLEEYVRSGGVNDEVMGKAGVVEKVGMGEARYVERNGVLAEAIGELLSGGLEPYGTGRNVEECARLLRSLRQMKCTGVELVVDLPSGINAEVRRKAREVLGHRRDWEKSGIINRWFVGQEWKEKMGEAGVAVYELTWNPEDLKRLLSGRFRAAGSRRIALEELGFEGLDAEAIAAAEGSPRRYVGLIERVVGRYVDRGGVLVERAEWVKILEEVK